MSVCEFTITRSIHIYKPVNTQFFPKMCLQVGMHKTCGGIKYEGKHGTFYDQAFIKSL